MIVNFWADTQPYKLHVTLHFHTMCLHYERSEILLWYHVVYFNPFPNDKILDWSILKQIADDIFIVHFKGKISAI